MERLVRKFDQRFRRAKEEISAWDALQGRLVKQFGNAAAIIERLPVLTDVNNYGVLCKETLMVRELPVAQTEALERLFRAMNKELGEFGKVSACFEKLWRDGCQLIRAEKPQPTVQQLQQRVGPRPSLQDCVDGLHAIHLMHLNEFTLKVVIVSALSYDSRAEDVIALQTLLAEQPNIARNEVQYISNLISAGEER